MAHNHTVSFKPVDLFKRIDAHTTTQDYGNREIIYAQGGKADAMFYIKNGNVKLTVMSKSGKKAVIAILEPAFAKLFISYLLFRIGRFQEEFVDQIFSTSERRLARVLLLLAGFGGQSKPEPVPLKVSQETLAEMVGTTRSRVSYFMNRFREKGLINYNGILRVHKSLLTFLLHE